LRPLYSVNLDDLISLSLRKAYSEMLPPDSFSEASPEHQNIHKVIEEQIEESPELQMVTRLSIFEEICPSEGPQSEQKCKTDPLQMSLGVSESNGHARHELDFFKVASGLSLEFDQKSADAEKLNVVKVDLPDRLIELSPQNPGKY
jgi:hypothetical protein